MSDADAIPFHRIASLVYNRPLLVLPSAAEAVSAFLLTRMGRGGGRGASDPGQSTQVFRATKVGDHSVEYHSPRISSFHGSYASDQGGRPAPYPTTPDGVAIITIVGELVNRGAWVGADSGLVSYEGIKFQLATAAADPRVKAIVLDLQTPGGEAIGAFEAAAAVRDAAKVKDVVAVVNGIAASGGYALACGATRIVTTPSGVCGSIGVLFMHLDISEALKTEGIKPTLIFAGAHKVDCNPFEPLPADVRADRQADVMATYDQFVATVAAGRPQLSEKQIRDTEARVFKGADAVKVGLADSVGTFEKVLAEISGGNSRRISQPSKGNQMAKSESALAADAIAGDTITITTVDQLRAAHPALCSELTIAGATAERTRILAIDAAAMPGHDAIIASHKADPTKSAGDAALAINAASRGKLDANLAALDTDENKLTALRSENPDPSAAGKQTAAPREVAALAVTYQAEQAKAGRKISAAEAVAHVSQTIKAVG